MLTLIRKDLLLHKTASWKGGGNPFVVIHRDGDGEPDGYALYHVRSEVVDGHFAGTVECRELEGIHWEVEAALWRYLCEIDLTDTVVAWPRPIDDPVQWRLHYKIQSKPWIIRALVDEQLMRTSVTYWEGAVEVIDGDSKQLLGRGYLEMTGY